MLEWIVTSCVLTILVIIIRFIFRRRLSLRVRYALWLAVALRLLVPLTISDSPFSVLNLLPERNSFEEIQDSGTGAESPNAGAMWMGRGENGTASPVDLYSLSLEAGSHTGAGMQSVNAPAAGRLPAGHTNTVTTVQTRQSADVIFFRIWLSGVLVSGGLVLVINLDFSRRLYRSRISFHSRPKGSQYAGMADRLPVYVSGVVHTPCLFGLLRPTVYLTPSAAKASESLHYVLCHESVHYRHRDHIWSLVRTVCLCLHWYNPFVWLAAALSRQDGELACDEETIQRLGEPERFGYGRALLEFCARGHVPLHSITLATTMSGGKRKLRERLEMIARQPKKTAGAVAAAALLVVLLLAVTFTGRKVEQEAEPLVANAAEQGAEGGKESDSSIDHNSQEESGEGGEITPQLFGYGDYTGYLDECLQWMEDSRRNFMDQDYDGDGLMDRVWRESVSDWEEANYRIEFGNGDLIEMNGLGGGIPYVRAVDLTGDGVREILFTQSYGFSTDPTAYGEMALFEKAEGGYRQMELPVGMVKEPEDHVSIFMETESQHLYMPTLTYRYEQAGEHSLRITCLETAVEAPLEAAVDFSAEDWELYDYGNMFAGQDFESPIWEVEILEGEIGSSRLLLHSAALGKWSGDEVVMTLGYRDGALYVENMQYYHVYFESVPIDLGDGESYSLELYGSTLLGSGLYRTKQVALVWNHDNAGEWLGQIDFSAAGEDSPGGSALPLEAFSPEGGIVLMDMNFDGAQDFCIQAWAGSRNTPYYCFVWDGEQKQFSYVGRLANVELDSENKRIVSSTVEGSGQYYTEYYYLTESNQLVLDRYVMEDLRPGAAVKRLDLTYREQPYSLPAIDDWEYESYGGGLHERIIYWSEQAMRELQQWTGSSVETAYFTVTGFGNFIFAQSEEDLRQSRTFYSRVYGSTAGFSAAIEQISLSTARSVWFSPVNYAKYPAGYESMSAEEIVIWSFEQWTGGAETVESIEENFEDSYVLLSESGDYYEVNYSDRLREVGSITGPYTGYPHH